MYFPSPREETFNDHILDSELLFIEKSIMMVRNESPRLSQYEKQIFVDPLSLKKPSFAYPSLEFSPPKLHTKTKLVTASLPNSAASSPRFSSKKKLKNQGIVSSLVIEPTPHPHSIALSRLAELKEKHHLKKSKSCGEGRATSVSEDFDMWSPKKINYPEFMDQPHEEKLMLELPKIYYDQKKYSDPSFDEDDKVKCGALCLFLPGLGKGKPVKPRKEMEKRKSTLEKETPWEISRTVSLEKFECGSWASSAIILESEEKVEDSSNLFFELPLELIQTSVKDEDFPVKAAFVFDQKDLKGVLKASASKGIERKSHGSSRQVRFSMSSSSGSDPTSPTTCITPRLRKAREDFNAFLQAQSA